MNTARKPAPTPSPSVEVCYPVERNLDDWIIRHQQAEVPGRWPYGLNELALSGAEVSAVAVGVPGKLRSAVARIPADLRVRLQRRSGRTLALAWDENVATRMTALRPRREMYSGAIWVTDRLVNGPTTYLTRIRSVLLGMDGVFVNSRAQVAPLRQFLGSDGPRVEFFRFGVDAQFWRPEPYPVAPLVVSVGGDRDRDAATLFAALARVHDRRPDVEIVVQSRSDLPAPPGVRKLSYCTHQELKRLYARASVIAVATKPNLHASGLTVSLESMATARPIVMSDAPGMDDYIVNGNNGWLTGMGDPLAMSERVLDLLADPVLAAEMGQRGRTAIERAMTTTHLARDLAGFMGLAAGA